MINDIVYNKPTIMWTLKGMQIDFSHNNLKLRLYYAYENDPREKLLYSHQLERSYV